MNIDTKFVNRYTGRKIPEAQWNQLCRLIRCNDNIFQDISLVSAIANAGQYFLHGVSRDVRLMARIASMRFYALLCSSLGDV